VEIEKIKRKDYQKTKFPGIYFVQDPKTKVKTYIARIKIVYQLALYLILLNVAL